MMLPIFGTPSSLTTWVVNTAKIASDVVNGRTALITANSIEELRKKWIDRKFKPLVFHADVPKKEIVELFQNTPGQMIIVSQPMAVVAAYASAARTLEAAVAVRFASRSFCSIQPLFTRTDVWHINSDVLSWPVDTFVETLIEKIYPALSEPLIRQVKAKITAANARNSDVAHAIASFSRSRLGDKTSALFGPRLIPDALEKFADDYEAFITTGDIQVVRWPLSVFTLLSKKTYEGELIDLTGPARPLIVGSALSVPKGRWLAEPVIKVAENFSGNELRVDLLVDNVQAHSHSIPLPVEGVFKCKIPFECEDPFFPIGMRLALKEGAIEGVLSLVSFDLLRV